MRYEIKHRYTNAVLFECEAPEGLESGLAMHHALEKAVAAKADLRDADLSCADLRGADLRDANLRDANLRGADLRDANLRGANLRDANLRDADLRDADLRDADLSCANGKSLRATPAESIENLDKVRAIILDDAKRLEMGHWHETSDWKSRTCAEETLCNTTHCLAGWLQVCSTNPDIRELDSQLAGILSAPVAAKMFFKKPNEVLEWLEKRTYADEVRA